MGQPLAGGTRAHVQRLRSRVQQLGARRRGAMLHVAGDLVQSLGVALAGALIWWKQARALPGCAVRGHARFRGWGAERTGSACEEFRLQVMSGRDGAFHGLSRLPGALHVRCARAGLPSAVVAELRLSSAVARALPPTRASIMCCGLTVL